jgi:hypothetical protein
MSAQDNLSGEQFGVASVKDLVSNSWDPNMGSVDKLIDQERPYIEKLGKSSAINIPITLRKMDSGKTMIWDGHHRVAAHHLAGKENINYTWDNS